MSRRIAIVGAGGNLGRELVAAFRAAGDDVSAFDRHSLDITRRRDLTAVAKGAYELVVNAAAWTDVDGCARDPERAMAVNGIAAGSVAEAASTSGAFVVHISTNEVFDGSLDRPYHEADDPHPVNSYGRSKLLGEELTARATASHLIVRTAWLFGPGGRSFVTKIRTAALRAAEEHATLAVVADEYGNPTWSPSLAHTVVQATGVPNLSGIMHLAGVPSVSRFDWAKAILDSTPVTLSPIASRDYQRPSTPPLRAVLDMSLSVERGLPTLTWREHV